MAADVILDEIIRLCPGDSKTNVCVPFSLKKDYQRLEFICSYKPKNCDDEERAKQLILEGLKTYVPPEYRERQHWSGGSWESFLSSVVSLITLSLDSPEAYLGCAHRHAPGQRHIVSAEFSSPGFFRYTPSVGDWRAVINVHAVVSPEVLYHLQIMAYNNEGG